MATIENFDPEYTPLNEGPDDLVQEQQPEPSTAEFSSDGTANKDLRSSNYIEGVQGWKLNTNGIAEFTGLIVKDALYTVGVNDDIQTAIDYVNGKGGGVIQLTSGTYTLSNYITLYSGIELRGAGRDVTYLNFNNTGYCVLATGTAGSYITNWGISNLTIQDSTSSGVAIDYGAFFRIENVRSYSNGQAGFFSTRSQYFQFTNCHADSNTYGFYFNDTATDDYDQSYGTLTSCIASSNSLYGFLTETSSTSPTYRMTYIACHAVGNTLRGFRFYDDGTGPDMDTTLIGCQARTSGTGFELGGEGIIAIGCQALSNTTKGFDIPLTGILIGSRADSNGNPQIDVGSTTNYGKVIVGNDYNSNSGNPSETRLAIDADTETVVVGNTNDSAVANKRVYTMYNGSGGTLNKGDTVVMNFSASLKSQITTTTTGGDDKVFGMALETIGSGAYGAILVEGFTAALKVNGTTAISAGDFLCTYTTAKIAKKAEAGDMAFAIALEAYSTADSDGVIDAVLITPRKL